jgi:RNase H-like domain found in reverse transcriptase
MQSNRPIAYLSKNLGIKNQALSTYEKELLALFTAVTKWKHYLIDNEFIIKTDQISLKHLLDQKVNTALQHKSTTQKGVDNKVADALSRCEGQSDNLLHINAELFAFSEIVPQWVYDIQEIVPQWQRCYHDNCG